MFHDSPLHESHASSSEADDEAWAAFAVAVYAAAVERGSTWGATA